MGRTMPITPFLEDNVFGPQEIRAMSIALEDLCNILNMDGLAKSERELLAQSIIALAHQGERDAPALRDRILREIAHGKGWTASLVRAARQGAL